MSDDREEPTESGGPKVAADRPAGDEIRLRPEQYERIKRALHHTEQFTALRRADTVYLTFGSDRGERGRRRTEVTQKLDGRRNAVGVRLEAFGLDQTDLDLWVPAFGVLTGMASWVVGVLEDFEGSVVWELGYLHGQPAAKRETVWILKRDHGSEERNRERYDNGMAASHLALFEENHGERFRTWKGREELLDAVDRVP